MKLQFTTLQLHVQYMCTYFDVSHVHVYILSIFRAQLRIIWFLGINIVNL